MKKYISCMIFGEKGSRKRVFFGIAFIVILIFCTQFGALPAGDDARFKNWSMQYTLTRWLQFRYLNWSARILPDALLLYVFRVPIFVFQVINSIFIFSFIYLLAGIYETDVKPINFIITAGLLGYISFGVLYSSSLWMTGTVNYLWPAVFALIIARFLMRYFYNGINATGWNWLMTIPATFVALGNEQILIVMFGVCIVSVVAYWVKHQKMNLLPIIVTLILLIGLVLMALSPGNNVRMTSEVAKWFPNFYSLSFFQRVYVGSVHLLNGIRIYLYPLIILFFLTSLLSIKNRTTKLTKVLLGMMTFSLLAVNVLRQSGIVMLPNFFNPGNHPWELLPPFGKKMLLLFCLLYLALVLFIALNYRLNPYPILTSFMNSAALLALLMLWLSPTLFGSMQRVFFVSATLLVLVLYPLLKRVLQERNYFFWLFLLYPLLNITLAGLKFLKYI